MEKTADGLRDDVADDPRNDDAGHGNRDNAAHLLWYAHADGGGDGLGKKGDILFVSQLEEQRKDQNRRHRGQNTGHGSRQNGPGVLFQQA